MLKEKCTHFGLMKTPGGEGGEVAQRLVLEVAEREGSRGGGGWERHPGV